MAGFLIPSAEQYRFLRRYKRQRRQGLERNRDVRASPRSENDSSFDATSGNAIGGPFTKRDNTQDLQNTNNDEVKQQHSSPPSPLSSRLQNPFNRKRRRRRAPQNDQDEDDSVGTELAAASHVSDFADVTGSPAGAANMDINSNIVEKASGDFEPHDGEQVGQACSTSGSAADYVAVAGIDVKRPSMNPVTHQQCKYPSDDRNSQPQQEATETSSAMEPPLDTDRIKLTRTTLVGDTGNAMVEPPSETAAIAAAAAAQLLAVQSSDNTAASETSLPPSQKQTVQMPDKTTVMERHAS
ncbi:MAG: hypothetical protein SGILL_010630, partial [Bacillariaceae sp.]